jgi:hypothetical protein
MSGQWFDVAYLHHQNIIDVPQTAPEVTKALGNQGFIFFRCPPRTVS